MTLMRLVLKTEILCCNRPMGWSEVGSKGARYQPMICIDFLACSPPPAPHMGSTSIAISQRFQESYILSKKFVASRDKGSTMLALSVSRNKGTWPNPTVKSTRLSKSRSWYQAHVSRLRNLSPSWILPSCQPLQKRQSMLFMLFIITFAKNLVLLKALQDPAPIIQMIITSPRYSRLFFPNPNR